MFLEFSVIINMLSLNTSVYYPILVISLKHSSSLVERQICKISQTPRLWVRVPMAAKQRVFKFQQFVIKPRTVVWIETNKLLSFSIIPDVNCGIKIHSKVAYFAFLLCPFCTMEYKPNNPKKTLSSKHFQALKNWYFIV